MGPKNRVFQVIDRITALQRAVFLSRAARLKWAAASGVGAARAAVVHRPSIAGQNETLGTVEKSETLFLVKLNEQDSLWKTMGCGGAIL
jgi:hypothetical protein